MKFTHPSLEFGTVSHGTDHYPVVDGVVDCPVEFGQAQGWTPVKGQAPAPDGKTASTIDLRTDGPTFEEYTGKGYAPSAYPPQGYAAKPSPGWTKYQADPTHAAADDADVEKALAGTVTDVEARMELVTTLDQLAGLQAAEVAGKNRKGVLDAIDARRGELQAKSTL